MSDDSGLWLLAMGPAGAIGLYWTLYRYYRNTDKSHAFEHETEVRCQPISGTDMKIDEVKGTRASSIKGDNSSAYRKRVNHMLKKPEHIGNPLY